jgi:fumarate reductase subunit C
VAVSIHSAIGLRVILHEATGLRGGALAGVTWGIGLAFLGLGARAVWAVMVMP